LITCHWTSDASRPYVLRMPHVLTSTAGASRMVRFGSRAPGPIVLRLMALHLVALGLIVWGAMGCSALGPCDRSDDGNPAVPFRGGTVVDGSYMSSDWTGPFLPFDGGQRYALEHGLESTPRWLECWVSFGSGGVGDGSMAPAAGNMCVVQEVNEEVIVIKNDTCSNMYVLVLAGAPWGGARSPSEGEP